MNRCEPVLRRKTMLSLDVAISTYKPEGVERVAKMLEPLPVKDGVRYIVSWQEHGNTAIPESLEKRGDVVVYRFDRKGLSNNRNNALDHCQGDIILIADDDLTYHKDFATKVTDAFAANPDMDVATFKIEFARPKQYPSKNTKLSSSLPKNYYVSSIELGIRRDSLGGLRFDPALGLGADKMHCGEEEVFLYSAIKKGLKCWFINEELATHLQDTTGDKLTEEVLAGHGYVIATLYPATALFRVVLKAYRLRKNKKGPFLKTLGALLKGVGYRR